MYSLLSQSISLSVSALRLQSWSAFMPTAHLSDAELSLASAAGGDGSAPDLAARPLVSQLPNLASSCSTSRRNLPARGCTQTSGARHLHTPACPYFQSSLFMPLWLTMCDIWPAPGQWRHLGSTQPALLHAIFIDWECQSHWLHEWLVRAGCLLMPKSRPLKAPVEDKTGLQGQIQGI